MISGQGEMQKTEFGALRESNEGRGRFDLIPYEALEALAKWYEAGSYKYAERNWEAGISVKDCINRMCRHAGKAASGWVDEDHLAAVMWNAAAAITMMKRKPECNDHVWQEPKGTINQTGDPAFLSKTFLIASPQRHEIHRLHIRFNQILEFRVRNGSLCSTDIDELNYICDRLLTLHNESSSGIPHELLVAVCNELGMMETPNEKAGIANHLISDDDRIFLATAIESGGISDLETLEEWINRRINK